MRAFDKGPAKNLSPALSICLQVVFAILVTFWAASCQGQRDEGKILHSIIAAIKALYENWTFFLYDNPYIFWM
jgi:hypothetical protein